MKVRVFGRGWKEERDQRKSLIVEINGKENHLSRLMIYVRNSRGANYAVRGSLL